ncbi:VOC family protein [Chryseobacterium sp. 3008163]|uniref:VOC family protein n=1 Tax=Chryseobacterium sp. 3008163 TaxID=2478663 RepID=UPI001E4E352E|nr:VOC family protein [Chryseobacterium sp. 3008163]
MKIFAKFILLFTASIFLACNEQNNNKNMNGNNPVVYFEIPVTNIERAEKFYTNVFNFKFEKEIIDNYEMMLFPFEETKSGISGALAKGDAYKPTKEGIIIYFKTPNIDSTLKKVLENKGKLLYPRTVNEKHGFAVAEFEDSEGNRIALHETIKNEN